MSRTSNRRSDPGSLTGETVALLGFVLLVLVGGGALYGAIRLGHELDGTAAGLPSDPFAVVIGLFTGKVAWPPSGTWIIAGAAVVLLGLGALIAVAWAKGRQQSSRVDRAASAMGSGREIEPLSRRSAAATAARWNGATKPGKDNPADRAVGVPIGRAVRGGQPLFGSWEDMHLDIWGPRTGKTTSRAVPAILDAPGSVLVTSNKRDVVDATRDIRVAADPVWVFDPQGIALEEPDWWWNPLSYVTDEVRAARLAEHFAAGSREEGSRGDAYFDNASQDLLAALLLAAALDERPITDVYIWTTRDTDEEPVDILRRHGYRLIERLVAGIIGSPDKQRQGVYGGATQMANCLTIRQVVRWVTPLATGHGKSSASQYLANGYDLRPQFDPARFVREGGTLYSLSKEGRGTAGPLVTALTVAVVEAAEELATRSTYGRLATPMLAVLDEAANVCRWRELPNLYSHYGSRGIVLMTILQSWSQGVGVWGEAGMNKLFSAANVFVYGGGVREDRFLESLSKIVGDYDQLSTSTSTGRGQRTTSRQLVRRRILDVDELAAMPKGRAVVVASGTRPTLIRTQPWMTGPHADAVRASITAHDPQAPRTIDEAQRELAAVQTSPAALDVTS